MLNVKTPVRHHRFEWKESFVTAVGVGWGCTGAFPQVFQHL